MDWEITASVVVCVTVQIVNMLTNKLLVERYSNSTDVQSQLGDLAGEYGDKSGTRVCGAWRSRQHPTDRNVEATTDRRSAISQMDTICAELLVELRGLEVTQKLRHCMSY
jgi:hypothetical protein